MIRIISRKSSLLIFALIIFALFFWLVYSFQLPLFIPFLPFLLLAEYFYIKQRVMPLRKDRSKSTIIVLLFFLLPWVLVMIFIISSLFIHPAYWYPQLKIYFVALIIISFSLLIFPVVFFLLEKLITVFSRKEGAKKDDVISRRSFLKRMGWLASSATLAVLTSGIFIWNHKFRIYNHKIPFKRLPKAFRGFRILQISDLHLGTWASEEDFIELVKLVNQQKADMVVFTGDLVDYMTREAYRFESYLREIKAEKGVFAILGNHDYGDYYKWRNTKEKEDNFHDLLDFYKKIGWNLLRNESVVIENGGEEILLSGVENWGNMKRYQKLANVPKAMKLYEEMPFKILLSHNPVHWEKKLQNYPQTIDLCLSGHTHGGQIGVEFNGFRWSPIQYLYRYWAGVYQETNQTTNELQTLYVNRGAGSIAYPGRIGILPEITVIELS